MRLEVDCIACSHVEKTNSLRPALSSRIASLAGPPLFVSSFVLVRNKIC